MATSNYYSDEDEVGGGAGGVIGGGGGGAPAGGAGAAAPSSNSQGSGFVNLQSYLDANQGGSAAAAQGVTQDFGKGVASSNQELAGINAGGMAGAAGADTSGLAVGPDVSQYGQEQALAGLESYGMSGATSGGYDRVGRDQEGLRGQADALANDHSTRREAVQRLYGSGRSSGFGNLDSFLLGADESAGLQGGLTAQTDQLGDVEAGRSQVQGAYDAANTQRADNTTANYQTAIGEKAAEETRLANEAAAGYGRQGANNVTSEQYAAREDSNRRSNRGGFGSRSKSTSGFGDKAAASDPYETFNKWDNMTSTDADKSASAEQYREDNDYKKYKRGHQV